MSGNSEREGGVEAFTNLCLWVPKGLTRFCLSLRITKNKITICFKRVCRDKHILYFKFVCRFHSLIMGAVVNSVIRDMNA